MNKEKQIISATSKYIRISPSKVDVIIKKISIKNEAFFEHLFKIIFY
jgi:hypothetical protein